ncbi:MAG: DNA-3-methyladenine glycosylase I [Actinobacteria bacterium]|nr:DNA-3-methyladenine glycosylase I [Actinomycetota bacterium]
MQAPQQITPTKLADYLEVMTKAVFQSGMSWQVVEAKWDGFLEAFAAFDPATVAAFTGDDVERLAEDARIIRNRRKIEATITNAETMVALDGAPGGFAGWLRSHADFAATVAALRGEFRFLGDMGTYYFLYVVGERVPPHEEWMQAHASTAHRASGSRPARKT